MPQLAFNLAPLGLDVIESGGVIYARIACPESGCDETWLTSDPAHQWIEHLPPFEGHIPNHFIHWGVKPEAIA